MDHDEVRLLPAAFIMVVSGQAAALLALLALASGHPLAPVAAAAALALFLAGSAISARRRWSLRLGAVAAPLASPIWVVVLGGMERRDDPSVGLFCIGMAAASWWAAGSLRRELRPPEWLEEAGPDADGQVPSASGWIEELPVSALPSRP